MFLTKRRRKSELTFGDVKMIVVFRVFLKFFFEFAALDAEEERSFLIWSLPCAFVRDDCPRRMAPSAVLQEVLPHLQQGCSVVVSAGTSAIYRDQKQSERHALQRRC